MSKYWFMGILIASLILVSTACSGSSAIAEPAAVDTPSNQADASAPEIDAAGIFAASCAGCHGTDRSGRNGPALLPERLTKDPAAYVDIITNGSGGMPAWGSRLSADEINALVDYILSAP
jgi:mono/diheme cytochrome c family protein